MRMYYGNIKKSDIANGVGVRVSLFVSGCTHHCKGCFNEETWNFMYGQEFTKETEEHILELLKPSYVSGLTVLGGEPLEFVNQQALLPFLEEVKKRYPEKTIWCYTGYVYEKDILERMVPKWKITKKILELLDVLVDGPFEEDKKDITLLFRGSSNQRLIDVQKSLAAGQTILWEPQD
jgi:anaerobic ribonucleoside-triphosphate reductase activating protein